MLKLTVGELRKALEGVPDDLVVELSSDTGVDQDDGGDVIVEDARRVTYKSCGETVDYFSIYANIIDIEDEEDEEGETIEVQVGFEGAEDNGKAEEG